MRGHLRHRQRYIFISTDRAQVVTGSHAGSHAPAKIRPEEVRAGSSELISDYGMKGRESVCMTAAAVA